MSKVTPRNSSVKTGVRASTAKPKPAQAPKPEPVKDVKSVEPAKVTPEQQASSVKDVTKDQPETSKKASKKSPMLKENFRIYIKRVLKVIREQTPSDKEANYSMSTSAVSVIDSIVRSVASEIAEHARNICISGKRSTVSMKDIHFGMDVVFADNSLREIVSKDRDVVVASVPKTKDSQPKRREFQYGLLFSVSLAEKIIRNHKMLNLNVSSAAPIALTRCLEALTRVILTAAVKEVSEDGKSRIEPVYLFRSINNAENASLASFFSRLNMKFYKVGVMPNIEPELLPVKKSKKAKKSKSRAAESLPEGSTEQPIKKKKRHAPGSLRVKDIKESQKEVDLLLQKAPFERVVRGYISQLVSSTSKHFGDGVIEILQQFVEDNIIELFINAQKLALHAERHTVRDTDVRMAWELCSGAVKIPLLNSDFVFPPAVEADGPTMDSIGDCGIQHLATRAGVVRKGNAIHAETRLFMFSLLMDVVRNAFFRVEHRGAVTITEDDIRFAFQMCGCKYLFFTQKKTKKAKKIIDEVQACSE